MTKTKYDQSFDEMLIGKKFQDENAIKFLEKDFTDDELERLSAQEFINLFTKAFVLICVQQSEIGLLQQKLSQQDKALFKLSEIYPELIEAQKSDTHFDIVKIKANLKSLKSHALVELLRKLPEIKKQSHKQAGSKGGIKRSKNDFRHHKMLSIKEAYLEKWRAGYRFPHGQLGEFYKKMAKEKSLDEISIKNAIEKYRRELGHTKPKKQSS